MDKNFSFKRWAEKPTSQEFKKVLAGREGYLNLSKSEWAEEYDFAFDYGVQFGNGYVLRRIEWDECSHEFKNHFGYDECKICKKTARHEIGPQVEH